MMRATTEKLGRFLALGLMLGGMAATSAQAADPVFCSNTAEFAGGESMYVWLKGENGEVADDFVTFEAKNDFFSFANDAARIRDDAENTFKFRYDLSGQREAGDMKVENIEIKVNGFSKDPAPDYPGESPVVVKLYPGGNTFYTANAKVMRWNSKPNSQEMALLIDLKKDLAVDEAARANAINEIYSGWKRAGVLIARAYDPGQDSLPAEDNTYFIYMSPQTSSPIGGAIPLKALETRVLESVNAQTERLKAGNC